MPPEHSHPNPQGHSALLAEVLETLTTHALRVTKQRVNMLKSLLSAKQPLSIEELRTIAAPRGEILIFTTVYRFMLELERIKLVRRVHVSSSAAHFELSLPHRHHDHLVCNGCGQVTAIEEECPVGELERRLASRYGFTELTHSLEFHGICPSCGPGEGQTGKDK